MWGSKAFQGQENFPWPEGHLAGYAVSPWLPCSAPMRPPARPTLSLASSQGSACCGKWKTGERKQAVQSVSWFHEIGPMFFSSVGLQSLLKSCMFSAYIRSHHYLRELDWAEHLKVNICHKASELAQLCFICALIRSISCFQV